MDANRFDTLLRSLFAMPSRRGLARLVTGLTVSGTLGSYLGLVEADAKKKRKKKKRCPAGKKKCAGACFPDDACCPPCTVGQTCLESGFCAIVCSAPDLGCPAGCACGATAPELVCIPDPPPCDTFLQSCMFGAPCPEGLVCALTACPGENTDRCMPSCEA